MKFVLLLPLFLCCSLGAMELPQLPPLHQAAQDGNREKVQQLITQNPSIIDSRAPKGFTPLHRAADKGNLEVVGLLLDHGANVNAQDNSKWTPLHSAADKGNLEVVRLLLDRGANIDAQDYKNHTPLHVATALEHLKVAVLLLAHGANINARNIDNHTPLHWAARFGCLESVRLLALLGAKREAKNNIGKTPADLTTDQDIRNYLTVTFPRTFPLTMQLLTAAAENNLVDLKQAIEHGADVDAFDRHGNTPLHFAAQHGNWRAAYFLLTHGADPSIENVDRETPIHIAWANNRYKVLGIFHMAAARNATKAHAFSQSMGEFVNSITPEEPPQKRRKI